MEMSSKTNSSFPSFTRYALASHIFSSHFKSPQPPF
jgi:hypothetical protein